MADTGAPDRKPGGKRRGTASAAAERAPCCGLPSPLASVIRVTVAARPEPTVAVAGETESATQDPRETF